MKSLVSFAAGALLITAAAAPAFAETVPVTPPPTFSYEADTVRQLEVRGEFGRYITFIGKTVNTYAGTSGSYYAGSPGHMSCVGGFCRRIGYVAPRYTPGTPGGTQVKNFTYELDCVDMTFDRKGNKAGGIYNRGWMPVSSDPTAAEVARTYCPQISRLPGGPTSPSGITTTASNGQQVIAGWTYFGHYGEGSDAEHRYTRRIGTEDGMPVAQTLYVNVLNEREEGLPTVWDCSGRRYRFQDDTQWDVVKRRTAGETEMKVICN